MSKQAFLASLSSYVTVKQTSDPAEQGDRTHEKRLQALFLWTLGASQHTRRFPETNLGYISVFATVQALVGIPPILRTVLMLRGRFADIEYV
jgi:hypothetical protein